MSRLNKFYGETVWLRPKHRSWSETLRTDSRYMYSCTCNMCACNDICTRDLQRVSDRTRLNVACSDCLRPQGCSTCQYALSTTRCWWPTRSTLSSGRRVITTTHASSRGVVITSRRAPSTSTRSSILSTRSRGCSTSSADPWTCASTARPSCRVKASVCQCACKCSDKFLRNFDEALSCKEKPLQCCNNLLNRIKQTLACRFLR